MEGKCNDTQRDTINGRYALLEYVGGGMEEAYLSRDSALDRRVAVKFPKPQHAENLQFVERFQRESKNAAALSHRDLVRAYDAGETAYSIPYMATEYVARGLLAGTEPLGMLEGERGNTR